MKLIRARVTSKGQVTLPKQIRDEMGIEEGDRILFSMTSPYEARLVIDKRPGASAGLMSHLARKGEAPSTEEFDTAAKRAVAAKFQRKAASR